MGWWREAACQNVSKDLNISSATTEVDTELLKALTILSDTLKYNVVEQKELKLYWKLQKRLHFWQDQHIYWL